MDRRPGHPGLHSPEGLEVADPALTERLFVLGQYLLPKRALTAAAGAVASARGKRWSAALIRWFVRRYRVDMGEAAQADITRYASFNDFFTRALKHGARPLADADLVCPVDGSISQFGAIEQGLIVQAKGHRYSTRTLLGGDAAFAARFDDGHFATLYLSPKDYHRIHMPCEARLKRMVHVPGALFSVNPATARGVPGLFARNERVICEFESVHGPLALVLVGATIVGSIATAWHGVVSPPRGGPVRSWDYADQPLLLSKGEEMGRFLLGSTVIVMLPRGPLRFNTGWRSGGNVRLGEAMADRPDDSTGDEAD
ncbi:MAG: Phosphatidylserine decarboxylase [Burkholderiaceae bacterium]|nr:MAG: Phosphatidylserine decarboxylase [Burkholderiaceae bacterium]